jgi:hypothetical protein
MSMHHLFGLLFALTGILVLWGMLTQHSRIPQWVHRHDKAMHFVAFALLAALAQGTWPAAPGWALWIGLSLLGLLTEALQHLLTSRSFCWHDATANAMGAATVLAFLYWQS